MKVLVVMGTRPEVIKLAPVIFELQGKCDLTICTTGQHKEMLDQALDCFSLEPDVRLECMRPGASLNVLAANLLTSLDQVIQERAPDWVIVQGDTTTAFSAGLAAFHREARVAHVEAGLRTGNLSSPFPEEANRTLLARIATRHFAPTRQACANLEKEGVPRRDIVVTGNTVVDALAAIAARWKQKAPSVAEDLDANRPIVFVTCHRRESFGGTLRGICQAIRELCCMYPGYQWIFPVHLNPAIREVVSKELSGIDNLFAMPPIDYESSLYLISKSRLVLSDSGGIQEEAPSFGVPVVVMREHTERSEGIEAGMATLAGIKPEDIVAAVRERLIGDSGSSLGAGKNPYGDGRAAQRIVSTLMEGRVSEFDG